MYSPSYLHVDHMPCLACFAAANSQNHSSTVVQPYAPRQPATPAGSIIVATQPKFSWYRAFVAAGLLLGFGVSAAVFVKVSSAHLSTYLKLFNSLIHP